MAKARARWHILDPTEAAFAVGAAWAVLGLAASLFSAQDSLTNTTLGILIEIGIAITMGGIVMADKRPRAERDSEANSARQAEHLARAAIESARAAVEARGTEMSNTDERPTRLVADPITGVLGWLWFLWFAGGCVLAVLTVAGAQGLPANSAPTAPGMEALAFLFVLSVPISIWFGGLWSIGVAYLIARLYRVR